MSYILATSVPANAVTGNHAPIALQTSDVDRTEQELFDLKASLDISDARREKALADIDKVQAEIQDLQTAIDRAGVDIATAQSSVKASADRIKQWARQMYKQPLSQALPLVATDNFHDIMVSRYYLSRTLHKDSDSLARHNEARQKHSEAEAELLTKKAELEQAKRDRERWQQIVDESIAAETTMASQLQAKLTQLQSSGTVPWGTIATCPQAPRTGVVGPWILEDWAVWTLKSIAMRTQTPQDNVVTREHIIALVAFAWGEGGGIQGHKGQFNPLNTNGWWRLFPELGGVPSGRGTDDWPTFDAGVEASARALTSKTQGRLGQVLVKPNTTASDYFMALASPELYAGNKNWSADDKQHISTYVSLTQRVTQNYDRFAGEVMRSSGQQVIGVPRLPTGQGVPGSLDSPLAC